MESITGIIYGCYVHVQSAEVNIQINKREPVYTGSLLSTISCRSEEAFSATEESLAFRMRDPSLRSG
jgi:hypothetical protein